MNRMSDGGAARIGSPLDYIRSYFVLITSSCGLSCSFVYQLDFAIGTLRCHVDILPDPGSHAALCSSVMISAAEPHILKLLAAIWLRLSAILMGPNGGWILADSGQGGREGRCGAQLAILMIIGGSRRCTVIAIDQAQQHANL